MPAWKRLGQFHSYSSYNYIIFFGQSHNCKILTMSFLKNGVSIDGKALPFGIIVLFSHEKSYEQ